MKARLDRVTLRAHARGVLCWRLRGHAEQRAYHIGSGGARREAQLLAAVGGSLCEAEVRGASTPKQ